MLYYRYDEHGTTGIIHYCKSTPIDGDKKNLLTSVELQCYSKQATISVTSVVYISRTWCITTYERDDAT